MAISNSDVKAAIDGYLGRHPEETARLAPLAAALEDYQPVATRSRLAGHVTCTAAIIDPSGRVLHIRHRSLGKTIFPGGHPEPDDARLIDCAAREAVEETGIDGPLQPFGDYTEIPLHVGIHHIPDRPDRPAEPAHLHFDFRYPFTCGAQNALAIQQDEIEDALWLPIADIDDDAPARERLAALAGRAQAQLTARARRR